MMAVGYCCLFEVDLKIHVVSEGLPFYNALVNWTMVAGLGTNVKCIDIYKTSLSSYFVMHVYYN